MMATLTISALAVNVLAADNNFVGGTDNIVETGVKSAGVVGYQNTIKGNNAVAFGENNVAAGTNSFAGGNDNKELGRDSFAYGAHAESKDAQSRISKLEALVNQLVEEVNAQKGI